jgi:thiol-disulfide isomerase/thioredoxin
VKLRAPMPDLKGAADWLNGEVMREELVGIKPTLIHFWSISCHLCKKAMPQIQQFRDSNRDKINVIAVHMPRSENDLNMEEIKQDAVKYGISHPVAVDSNLTITNAFENQYVPAYYLFDKEGQLRHFQVGGSGMTMLEKRINRLIDEIGKTE